MKLIDALKLVDRSQEEAYFNYEPLIEALSITNFWGVPGGFEQRVTVHWLMKWMCTDTWVGMRAMYFDNELAGMIWQSSRKGDADVQFVSAEIARKLRDYILSANPETEFPLIDATEEIDATYGVSYGSQLLVTTGLYNGKPVTVDRESIVRNFNEPVDEWSKIVVKDEAGNEFKINLEDFHIPLNITGGGKDR